MAEELDEKGEVITDPEVINYIKRNRSICQYCNEPMPVELPDSCGSQGLFHNNCQKKHWDKFEIWMKERDEGREKRFKENKAEFEGKDLCHLCGLTCNIIVADDTVEFSGLNGEVHGGFHSTPGNGDGALDDGNRYRFKLCEFCIDFLFSSFVIPPDVSDYMSEDKREAFRPASQRVQEDEWRKTKEKFFAEYNRRKAQRKI